MTATEYNQRSHELATRLRAKGITRDQYESEIKDLLDQVLADARRARLERAARKNPKPL